MLNKKINPNVILMKIQVNGKVTMLEFSRETELMGQIEK